MSLYYGGVTTNVNALCGIAHAVMLNNTTEMQYQLTLTPSRGDVE